MKYVHGLRSDGRAVVVVFSDEVHHNAVARAMHYSAAREGTRLDVVGAGFVGGPDGVHGFSETLEMGPGPGDAAAVRAFLG